MVFRPLCHTTPLSPLSDLFFDNSTRSLAAHFLHLLLYSLCLDSTRASPSTFYCDFSILTSLVFPSSCRLEPPC